MAQSLRASGPSRRRGAGGGSSRRSFGEADQDAIQIAEAVRSITAAGPSGGASGSRGAASAAVRGGLAADGFADLLSAAMDGQGEQSARAPRGDNRSCPAPRAPQLRANDEPKNERAPMLDRSVLSESRGRKGGSGRQRAAERGRSGQRRNTENAEYSMKFSASELLAGPFRHLTEGALPETKARAPAPLAAREAARPPDEAELSARAPEAAAPALCGGASRRPRGLVMRSMPKKRAAAARQLRVALPP